MSAETFEHMHHTFLSSAFRDQRFSWSSSFVIEQLEAVNPSSFLGQAASYAAQPCLAGH